MRKLRLSFVNGTDVHLTTHELLGFFREPRTVAWFMAAMLLLFLFQPFPALASLPLAEELVFWGIVLPCGFFVYLATLITMARVVGRGLAIVGHGLAAVLAGALTPDLGLALGLPESGIPLPTRGLIVAFSLVWSVGIEFLMATFLLPDYLRRIEGRATPPTLANLPTYADTPFPDRTPEPVVLLGRSFALPDLLLVSADEHYVHIHTVKGRQMLRGRISDIEAQLPDAWGLRVHRSHWVAARSVRALHRAREGWTLELTDGQRLPVARARREAVGPTG